MAIERIGKTRSCRELLIMNSLISFISFNMQGYNQGKNLLESFCSDTDKNFDIILLQEHWLTPANLYKLSGSSDNYTFLVFLRWNRQINSLYL